jgi:hypothetical protein
MKNLYKWELKIRTGELTKEIKEDVTVANKTEIVRRKERAYDLKYRTNVRVKDLNIYIQSIRNDKIEYFSLSDDINIETMKDMACEQLVKEREELEKMIAYKQQIIHKIMKLEV